MRYKTIGSLILILLTASAVGQPAFVRPGGGGAYEDIAAGYLALFTCSAHFMMRRPLDDILRVEMIDLAALDLPPPQIDTQRQWVRARDHHGNEVIAAYRDSMGCTVLPPHWREADVASLPYIALAPRPDRSKQAFPAGDAANVQLSAAQKSALQRAFDGVSYGEGAVTLSVLVIKDKQLVGEMYRDGFGVDVGYRTWSTAKSVAATLVGIAVGEGLIDIDEPVNVPEWQYFNDPRRAITWRHLLNMSSGLESAGAGTGALYFGGQDVVSAVTQAPLVGTPGATWKYANADTLLLLYGLRNVLDNDLDYLRFPYDKLFHKLGMFNSRYEIDHLGNFVGSSQMYTTARDLARFGLLYLYDGVWEGERILPQGWTDFVAQPAPGFPRKVGERGYGGQFWLLDQLPGVPAGTYTTAGNKGQFAIVLPAENMVIVRTGVDPNGVQWDLAGFIRDMLATFSPAEQ